MLAKALQTKVLQLRGRTSPRLARY